LKPITWAEIDEKKGVSKAKANVHKDTLETLGKFVPYKPFASNTTSKDSPFYKPVPGITN